LGQDELHLFARTGNAQDINRFLQAISEENSRGIKEEPSRVTVQAEVMVLSAEERRSVQKAAG
jgi:hypothetical protein